MPVKNILIVWLLIPVLHSLQAQNSEKSRHNSGDSNWLCYGHDAGGTRYSSLQQINDKNVAQLTVAWTFQTGELKTYSGTNAGANAAFEATPLMIDNSLFFSTPSDRVFAIDAATGQQKWLYDPHVDLHQGFSEITSRGVSTWPSDTKASKNGKRRIFVATIDGRLIALDALTGTLIASFGNGGTVDLREGIDLKEGIDRHVSVTSPPAVIGDLIVVGSSLGDNQRFDYPKGTVRAYNALTGKLAWSWDPIPNDSTDKAWQTWQGPKAHKTGAANAWGVISADVSRDLVFIPTSCPSPDYYGGERLGQNLYGNSIVALKASTGKLVWYYQVVHHDLWDDDIAAEPMLIDVIKSNKKIPAVAVGTKMGLIFILNRETGEPLYPIEERKVPVSTVPGEQAWKTQPFPTLPAPLGLQHISASEAWGLNDSDREEATKRIARYRYEGPYTPPSYEGSLMTPGNVGGINWSGMCYDPAKGLLITNVNRLAAVIRMIPRERVSQLEKSEPEGMRAETGRQEGTPYVMKRDYLFKVNREGIVMQTQPPWGTLAEINVNTGAKNWEVPLGYMMDPSKHPGAEKWGSINFGGATVTAGNLILVAATMDNHLRAFNADSGEMLWESALPASAQAAPMTYQLNGKQYIVIAAGGHGKLGTKMGDYVVAYTLK